jgi:hypothetical protein
VPPKCCTDALKYVPTISVQNSAINVVRSPWETCQNFQKTTLPSRNLCQNNSCTDRTESVQYGLYFLPRFMCPFPAVRNSKICIVRPFLLDCTFPRFLCLLFLLYGLLNPYNMAYLHCCPCCLDFYASLQPWNVCPSSAEMASSPNSKMLSLLLSQQ